MSANRKKVVNAEGVWIGNSAWPSNRSLKEFAEDCFRLSGAKSDKEKALCFYYWMIMCVRRGGPNPVHDDGCGSYARYLDPLVNFTSWGDGECTFWGWIAVEALCLAGLKARRVAAHKMGHTFYEVWYKGGDGREQWHAFDPFGGWYFLNENGEVASCAELAANPQLVQNPLPGHSQPLGTHLDRAHLAHRHQLSDQLFIDQPIFGDRLGWDLRKGQQVSISWLPEAPDKALFTRHPEIGELPRDAFPDGAHGDIPALSRTGEILFPEHEPYWKNYRRPSGTTHKRNEGLPVRWHGSGGLRWKPLLQGETACAYASNARFENGMLRPKGPHYFLEVWYHFKLPYLVSSLMLDYDIAGDGGDYCGFAVSADDRRTVWPLEMKSHGPHWGSIVNGQREWKAGKPSVQGLREFWLRIDMFSHSSDVNLALQALDVTVRFQHNMDAQPRLVPGRNDLWIEAGKISGSTLESEWVYQVDGTQRKTKIELASAGRAEETVEVDVDSPERILMTGLRLNCR